MKGLALATKWIEHCSLKTWNNTCKTIAEKKKNTCILETVHTKNSQKECASARLSFCHFSFFYLQTSLLFTLHSTCNSFSLTSIYSKTFHDSPCHRPLTDSEKQTSSHPSHVASLGEHSIEMSSSEPLAKMCAHFK